VSITCKNRRPYNLYCVAADVKPCSINQFIQYNDVSWTTVLGLQITAFIVVSIDRW